MSSIVVFDTSIFIDHLRTGRYHERIEQISGLVRNSAVVLAELLRGATKPAEREFVQKLARNHPVLIPSEKNWLESGYILGTICADHGYGPEKLRDLHFDILIAFTARACGARLITSNRADFELINRYRKVQLEIW